METLDSDARQRKHGLDFLTCETRDRRKLERSESRKTREVESSDQGYKGRVLVILVERL